MASKKYAGLNSLSQFLTNLRLEFANIVHSHTVAEITDFPIIPVKTSDLINDSGFVTETGSTEEYTVLHINGGNASSFDLQNIDGGNSRTVDRYSYYSSVEE